MTTKRGIFSSALDASMLDFRLGLVVEDLEEEETQEARQTLKEIQFIRGQLKTIYNKLMELQKDE